MNTLELKLFTIFKKHFGQEEAEVFFEYFEANKTEQIVQQEKNIIAKNFAGTDKLENTKLELIERIHFVELEIKKVENNILEKMQKDKNDLMRWYFAYWISIILLIITNYFLLKKV
jgi:hypothetical protein